ncbi:NAD(P)/FAD-dependent oxidoreductase [Helicobacter muridarum]|uniref:NAD(P)/FAD-dependent oxidoreductase n=1 Tax=Helicobacter muridarum TaxID=216 RepID=A0A099TXV4_9HELI|nr:FAD-dependent oxidoreductase [Helicobacter muridarum]TLE00886.1 NAD(P)/FAD-dependent oxidoreductase [Helicobacter muridarum]STQ86660.1 thioredoxin-disulfide reductase [Helicobacter muridarum]
MKKSIIIIGGSIAGLSAALVLASAKSTELDFDISIIDDNKADLNAAAIYNVPLFPRAITGKEIIEQTKMQIDSLLKVEYIVGTVSDILGKKGDFQVKGYNINKSADYIILATGASRFDINGLGDIIRAHTLMNKPNKIKLHWNGRQEVKDGIYVAGLASGVTTMVTCAMGSAVEAACAILSDINGEITIVHDTPTSR